MNDIPLLLMKEICKNFPGTIALDHVNFELKAGEVHCLVGENGAGKSTLMKILSGALLKDSGHILINGEEVNITSPDEAFKYGIGTVYQELAIVPALTVAENIFLGIEPQLHLGKVDWPTLYKRARDVLELLGLEIDLRVPVESLSVAYQQLVVIAKALIRESRILIMDEPSAVLSGRELEILFDIIRRLKNRGVGVIYISHRLGEIFEIGDRVTILRDGKWIATKMISDTDETEIIQLMVGRELGNLFSKEKIDIGEPIMEVSSFEIEGTLHNVSFKLRKGEILGIAGLVGAGRTTLARAIVGAIPKKSGKLKLKDREVVIKSPKDALSFGIGMLPEDRKMEGLILCRSVEENISLTFLHKCVRYGILNFSKIFETSRILSKQLNIKAYSFRQRVDSLSGGNQQKVVLAKWIGANCDVIIFDEPTRGIDVGAKKEIYHLICNLVKEGKSIIMISSDLPEVMALSDRIIVMSEGRITGEFSPQETSQEEILRYALPDFVNK